MTLGTHLSLRIAAILVAGFVIIQFLVFGAMIVPGRQVLDHPYSFPPPRELAAIVDTLEQAPPEKRRLLVAALDGSLYTLSIEPALPDRRAINDLTARDVERTYQAVLPGHLVRLSARRAMFPKLMRDMAWPGRLLAPATLAVSLRSGGVLVLVSRPSTLVRDFLGERAAIGAVAGLILLGALALAVRQSTRPVTRLAGSIRAFSNTLDAPDLPIEGGPELRDLAAAYNDMKGRIAGLVSERTRILAGIAHDLRTYLTRLRLRAEFIDDPDQRERAARDLSEMSLLLDDTLLFAQPASRPMAAERIAIGAELETIAETRREMGEAVTLAPIQLDLFVRSERLALRRAIANLIDNGLRHGSSVLLSGHHDGDDVLIVVTDDGPGVPPDLLARLGRAFDRLDPSRDRTTGGAGLGLAIVRALMDRQGGSVSFRNGAAGGLEVTLRLPAA
ncbi:ATP-binding protein [Sphingomonas sp.]|uniref:ATP-binding protein n=1 Tax=Sphingomonas sp. TaxID=28214 RepID=UPI000DB3445E|nr:ATP-binding protein [Sphingomonas sp.]PZU09839.1 MAG: two-component sensor histidine kinase [Sphingomonas sp.]